MSWDIAPARVIVCTTCRDDVDRVAGSTGPRAGARLYARLLKSGPWPIEIVAHPCLSGCKRSCAFALQAPARWTYLFGDCADDDESVADIHACVELYLSHAQGFMDRRDRPTRLQAGVLARVPPMEFAEVPFQPWRSTV